MILSGPKAWRGSTKDARIFPHFLHSAIVGLIQSLFLAESSEKRYLHAIDDGRGLWSPISASISAIQGREGMRLRNVRRIERLWEVWGI
jgi:hypothetical protein